MHSNVTSRDSSLQSPGSFWSFPALGHCRSRRWCVEVVGRQEYEDPSHRGEATTQNPLQSRQKRCCYGNELLSNVTSHDSPLQSPSSLWFSRHCGQVCAVGSLSEPSAVCQNRWQSVRGVGSLSATSGVFQRRRGSVRDVRGLSEPSAVSQSRRQSLRAVGSLSEPSAVCQSRRGYCGGPRIAGSGASADRCSLALPHLRWGLWAFESWSRDYFCSQVGTIFSTFRHSRPWGDRVEDQSVYMICTFRHFRPGV